MAQAKKSHRSENPFAALAALKGKLPKTPPNKVVALRKKQPADKVIGAVDNHLVSACGLTAVYAAMAREQMFAVIGGVPHNSSVVLNNLNHPQAVAILASVKAEQDAAERLRQQEMAAARMAAVAAAEAAAAEVEVATPKTNAALSADVEMKLHELLLVAVKSGEETQIDAALRRIVKDCQKQGMTFFVTQFANWTKVSSLLIGRLMSLRLEQPFGLEWTDKGLGSEVLPKAEKPKAAAAPKLDPSWFDGDGKPVINYMLGDARVERLTKLLVDAVENGTSDQMADALEALIVECRSVGQDFFVTPFRNNTVESGLIIRFLMKREDKAFGFYWTADGLGTPVRQMRASKPATERKGPPSSEKARKAARSDRDRQARERSKSPSVAKPLTPQGGKKKKK